MPKNQQQKQTAAVDQIRLRIRYGGKPPTSHIEKTGPTTMPKYRINTAADPPARRPRPLRDFAMALPRYATIRDQGGHSHIISAPDKAPRPARQAPQIHAAVWRAWGA